MRMTSSQLYHVQKYESVTYSITLCIKEWSTLQYLEIKLYLTHKALINQNVFYWWITDESGTKTFSCSSSVWTVFTSHSISPASLLFFLFSGRQPQKPGNGFFFFFVTSCQITTESSSLDVSQILSFNVCLLSTVNNSALSSIKMSQGI